MGKIDRVIEKLFSVVQEGFFEEVIVGYELNGKDLVQRDFGILDRGSGKCECSRYSEWLGDEGFVDQGRVWIFFCVNRSYWEGFRQGSGMV